MYKILVIDDDLITLELLQLILEEFILGEITMLSSSSEAISFVENDGLNTMDLVICDWQMPEHDGLEVLAAIRKKNKQIPFLMLTGNATRDLVLASRAAGVSDFIAKPFKNHDLTEKVNRLLK